MIFSRDEVLDFFNKYKSKIKNKNDFDIIPLSDEDETDDMEVDDIDDEYNDIVNFEIDEDDDDIINSVENILDSTSADCFKIEVPGEVEDEYSVDELNKFILSNEFNSKERNMLFELMLNYCFLNTNEKSFIPDEAERANFKKFIDNCSLNDFVVKFFDDREFAKKVAIILETELMDDYYSDELGVANQPGNVLTINDLIRKTLITISNQCISKGYYNNDIVYLIIAYLIGKMNYKNLNKICHDSLDVESNADILRNNRSYIIIILITDYLRYVDLKTKSYGGLDDYDYDYVNFIDKNNIKDIIQRFKEDIEFSFEIVSSFIEINMYCSLNTIKSCNNYKIIKKINPLYILDYKDLNNK